MTQKSNNKTFAKNHFGAKDNSMQKIYSTQPNNNQGASMKITSNPSLFILPGLAVLALAFPGLLQAADVAKASVIFPVTVPASSGGIAGARYVGLNVARPVLAEGRLASAVSNNATSFTVDSANFLSGVTVTTNNTSDSHYSVEFTSGPYVGLIKRLSSVSGTTATVLGSLPALDNGTTILLRKDWTLGSLFGATASDVAAKGLTAGSSGGSATRIGVLNSNGVVEFFFFKNSTTQGGVGWRSAATRTDGVDRQHLRITTGSGFVVQNGNTSPLTFHLAGEARPTRSIVSLDQTFTLVANPQNTAVSLASLLGAPGTGTGLESGMTGASSAGSADEVTLLNGTFSTRYFFYTQGGVNKWRLSANRTGADQNSVQVAEGDALLIKRNTTTSKFVGLKTSADVSE
jgi:hypothetical protein